MSKGPNVAIEEPIARQELFDFHRTGARREPAVGTIDGLALRPALLAAYHDLKLLRYDFPVVLVAGEDAGDFVRSLSSLVDDVLRTAAPRGIDGERLRRQGLRLEREIRALVAAGWSGSLVEAWSTAATRVAAEDGETLERVLADAAATLDIDGRLVDCTHEMPAELFRHAWNATQDEKARKFHGMVGRLVARLTDILRAAHTHSPAGRTPQALKAAVGSAYEDVFDFSEMSRMLAKGARAEGLSESRRRRIEWALGVLENQRFFPVPPQVLRTQGRDVHRFEFDDCSAAMEAFRQRLPEIVELVKAMSMAELEIEGRYQEARDDALFATFGEASVTPDDLQIFPDYFVRIASKRGAAQEIGPLMQMLSSSVPVKVLVQVKDAVEESTLGSGNFVFGVRSAQLASTALGLDDVFVLQTTSSNVYALRERIHAGMTHHGPALFSVFCPFEVPGSPLPPYLLAAAATQSRAFPTFVYDPSRGPDLATRFSLEDNPQLEADWPVEPFEYSNAALQRVDESVAFTLADYLVCDPRHARHFARVPNAEEASSLLPVADWLARRADEVVDQIPYVLAVDGDDTLHHLVVDVQVMHAARACRASWHRLRELDDARRSHTGRPPVIKSDERETTSQEVQKPVPELPSSPTPEAVGPALESADGATSERSPDVAYIETERCTTCEECRMINGRMFAYNANKQAYIADLSAGTYGQLVAAAESCQVAIIHPGKPINPNEPGLEELLKRAEPFR